MELIEKTVTATDIFNLMRSNISSNCKQTPSGWLSFNAPCCPHVGNHRQDKLKRGGIRFINGSSGIVYHCFNCQFSTAWTPGKNLSNKFQSLMIWMGIDESTIKNLSWNIWSENRQNPQYNNFTKDKNIGSMEFNSVTLPQGSIPLMNSITNGITVDNSDQLKYLQSRGDYILSRANDFYTTTSKKDTMNRRIIIPFYWDGDIVGYVGRSIDETNYKYFGNIPKDYIFNTEIIQKEHNHILVVEGPFDALSVNGVALLGDKCSTTQINWLENLNKNIIIIPDRDGKKSYIKQIANERKWNISEPDWGYGVKDCADAVKKYGRLYTIQSIFNSRR